LPDPAKWGFDIGHEGGWGNDELEYYTSTNASQDGRGNLVITATPDGADRYQCSYGPCRYISSRIVTIHRFSRTFGRFEARIKIPRGHGIWPAFWALGDDIPVVGWPRSGEIDIMENIGREPGTTHGGLHAPAWDSGDSYTLPKGAALADDYHTFAADWRPDRITFTVDGNPYHVSYRADAPPSAWVFHKPFFLLLNVAVGGRWPGNPDTSTNFPQHMLVDYVRVYDDGYLSACA
jgi:beta-glucanase (GH16 family)